jgi:hypothetical protein
MYWIDEDDFEDLSGGRCLLDGTFLDPLKHICKNDGIVSKYLSGGQEVHRPPQCDFVNIDADGGGNSFDLLLVLPPLSSSSSSGGCIQYGPSTLQS